MRPLAIAASVALCATVAGAAPQARPDLSGRWEVLEQEMPASIAQTITVTQTTQTPPERPGGFVIEPFVMLAVQRQFGPRFESARYTIGAVGGTMNMVSFSGGSIATSESSRSTRSAAKWENAGLVLGTATFVGTAEVAATERYELWSLGDDGILTITIGERNNGGELRTTKATYRRAGR